MASGRRGKRTNERRACHFPRPIAYCHRTAAVLSSSQIFEATGGPGLEWADDSSVVCAVLFVSIGHVHTAPTTDKNSWLNRPRWSARYFVLRYGHWFWFRDEKALLTGGLSACLGSLSLLLNPFTIDLHPKYTTRFFVRFGDWYSVQIDTSIERKDRGEWALLFLASGNLVSEGPPRAQAGRLRRRVACS